MRIYSNTKKSEKLFAISSVSSNDSNFGSCLTFHSKLLFDLLLPVLRLGLTIKERASGSSNQSSVSPATLIHQNFNQHHQMLEPSDSYFPSFSCSHDLQQCLDPDLAQILFTKSLQFAVCYCTQAIVVGIDRGPRIYGLLEQETLIPRFVDLCRCNMCVGFNEILIYSYYNILFTHIALFAEYGLWYANALKSSSLAWAGSLM